MGDTKELRPFTEEVMREWDQLHEEFLELNRVSDNETEFDPEEIEVGMDRMVTPNYRTSCHYTKEYEARRRARKPPMSPPPTPPHLKHRPVHRVQKPQKPQKTQPIPQETRWAKRKAAHRPRTRSMHRERIELHPRKGYVIIQTMPNVFLVKTYAQYLYRYVRLAVCMASSRSRPLTHQ